MEIQETRRYILEILRDNEECTVDEIVEALSIHLERSITTVTIRHHLERLRSEGLVNPPRVRRRNSPGRPQYAYSLTDKAMEYFPNNYAGLADGLLDQLKQHLPQEQVNVILEGMADSMAAAANIPQGPLPVRLDHIVAHMNDHGYAAEWEESADGYILTTTNCPYERVVSSHEELCQFDLRMVASMLGVVPRFVGRMRDGANACQYLIPYSEIVKS